MPTFVGEIQKPTKMTYSNEDLERFYIRYQAEAMPRGESIQSFCDKNKVPFNLFNKWYRDTRHSIVNVHVDGASSQGLQEAQPRQPQTDPAGEDVRIMVDIRMTNGLHIRKRGMVYADLKRLIAKLEALC